MSDRTNTPDTGGPVTAMTLLDWFAGQVTYQEAEEIVPLTIKDCAAFVGVDPKDYVSQVHYPQAIAKAKYMLSAAMVAEKRRREAGDA